VSDKAGRLMIWVGVAPGVSHVAVKHGGGPPKGGARTDLEPSVSASGAIAYASDVSGNFDLFVAEPGGGTSQLTSDPQPEYDPAWSPDESQLAFVRGRLGHGEIYVVASDGGEPTQLTHKRADDTTPAWSPNGQHLVFASNRRGSYDLWVMTSGHARQLTHGPAQDFAPAWSPNGTRIAFTRQNKKGNSDIYVVNPNGRHLRRLTHKRADESEPTWSPDSHSIAYSRRVGRTYQIYVMTAKGKKQTNFSQAESFLNISPSWHGSLSTGRAAAQHRARSSLSCTIGPNPRKHVFTGSPSADVICGNDRKDVIRGGGGNDVIFGNGGADVIHGGRGDDLIFGEPGKDRIFGGPGNDKIITNDGHRQKPISGGKGSDQGRLDRNPPDKATSIEAPLGRTP
jgi:hemolysin type calcium-binding protein/WD40 repeat protein